MTSKQERPSLEQGALSRSILPEDWEPNEFATLIYILKGDEVLLINKLQGHGAGKVNVPGGHIEVGETPEECAIREAFEEVRVVVKEAELHAVLRFHDTVTGFSMLGYAFVTNQFLGDPQPSAEATPFWSKINAIPFEKMWECDQFWVRDILAGDKVECEFQLANDELKNSYICKLIQ